jgi:hypothetical protein
MMKFWLLNGITFQSPLYGHLSLCLHSVLCFERKFKVNTKLGGLLKIVILLGFVR